MNRYQLVVFTRLAQLVGAVTVNVPESPRFNPWPGRGMNFGQLLLAKPSVEVHVHLQVGVLEKK